MFSRTHRTLLSLLITASIGTSTIGARVFHGPYAGLELGYAKNTLKLTHSMGSLTGSKKPALGNWLVGGHGGYGRTFENHFYLGFEAFATYGGMSNEKKDLVLTSNGTSVTRAVKLTRVFSGGLDLRFGYQFKASNTPMVLYVGPTIQMTQWKAMGALVTGTERTDTKTSLVMGYGPLIGYEARLNTRMSLGVVGKYIMFGKAKLGAVRAKPSGFSGQLVMNLHI